MTETGATTGLSVRNLIADTDEEIDMSEIITLALSERLDRVASIIMELDGLPADHEPKTEDLWEAIRRIEILVEGD